MDFFYLEDFDNLSNHADTPEIASRLNDNLGMEPFSRQLLGGFPGQLVILAVGCPEDPAAAFHIRPLHHAVDCERTGGVLLHGGASSQ
jgi:hypothetical protein